MLRQLGVRDASQEDRGKSGDERPVHLRQGQRDQDVDLGDRLSRTQPDRVVQPVCGPMVVAGQQ